MIRRAVFAMLFFAASRGCVVSPAWGQEAIRFPEIVSPSPAPDPASVPRLTADVLYVISSTKPFIVLASSETLLSVTMESGPLAIRGKFIESPDKSQTRRIADPYIAIIEATGTGRAELIVIPVGVQKQADIVRRLIDAETGPRPPPAPPVPPNPPAPEPTALYKTLKAAYDADLDADKAALVLKLAEVLDGAVSVARKSPTVKTAKQFTDAVAVARKLQIGESIPTTRNAVGVYLQTVLPREQNTPADDAYYAKAASEYGYVALTLKGLVR